MPSQTKLILLLAYLKPNSINSLTFSKGSELGTVIISLSQV